jgi:hypothetical protein
MGFETYPFPEGLIPNLPAADYADDPRAIAIAEVARRLNELREAWLNPPDLVERLPEVVPGYPDRIVPVSPKAAAILKTRTLTNLYNERPTWLDNAHRELDAAVAAATAGQRTLRKKRRCRTCWPSTSNAPPWAGSWLRSSLLRLFGESETELPSTHRARTGSCF